MLKVSIFLRHTNVVYKIVLNVFVPWNCSFTFFNSPILSVALSSTVAVSFYLWLWILHICMKVFWCFHLPLFWCRGGGRFLPGRSISLSKSKFEQEKKIAFLSMKKENFCYGRRVYWKKRGWFKFTLRNDRFVHP